MLLVKRASSEKRNPAKWDLPGGRVLFGENPDAALRREIKEETTITVEDFVPYHIMNHMLKSTISEIQVIRILYLVWRYNDGLVKLRKAEHIDYQWVLQKEIEGVNLAFKKKIIRIIHSAISFSSKPELNYGGALRWAS